MALSQRKKRILLMQAIFQLPFHKEEESFDFEAIEEWLKDQSELVYEEFLSFADHQEEIDGVIDETLVGWDIHRLAKVDLALLRVAVYEFLFCEEIPAKVSINEAVELAKRFSTDDSSRFINGILGSVIKKYGDKIKKGCQ